MKEKIIQPRYKIKVVKCLRGRCGYCGKKQKPNSPMAYVEGFSWINGKSLVSGHYNCVLKGLIEALMSCVMVKARRLYHLKDFDIKKITYKPERVGLTAKLRRLKVGQFLIEKDLRTSEIYIFAKRLNIKIKSRKLKGGLKITRIK